MGIAGEREDEAVPGTVLTLGNLTDIRPTNDNDDRAGRNGLGSPGIHTGITGVGGKVELPRATPVDLRESTAQRPPRERIGA